MARIPDPKIGGSNGVNIFQQGSVVYHASLTRARSSPRILVGTRIKFGWCSLAIYPQSTQYRQIAVCLVIVRLRCAYDSIKRFRRTHRRNVFFLTRFVRKDSTKARHGIGGEIMPTILSKNSAPTPHTHNQHPHTDTTTHRTPTRKQMNTSTPVSKH